MDLGFEIADNRTISQGKKDWIHQINEKFFKENGITTLDFDARKFFKDFKIKTFDKDLMVRIRVLFY